MRPVVQILLTCCVVTGYGRASSSQNANAPLDLKQEIALTEQAGYPTTVRSLQAPAPPAAENAAPLYAQLALAGGRRYEVEPAVFTSLSYLPTRAEILDGDAYLKRHKTELDVVKLAARRPKCVFKRDWQMPNLDLMQYPEFPLLRRAARLLAMESQVLASRRHYDEAIADISLIFRVARHAGTEPILLAYLPRVAIERIGAAALHKLIWQSSGSPNVATRIRRLVDSEWRPHSLQLVAANWGAWSADMIRLYRVDRSYMERLFYGDSEESMKTAARLLQQDKAWWQRTFDRYEALELSRARRVAQVIDLPYWKALPTLRQIEQEEDIKSGDEHYLQLLFGLADPMKYAYKKPQVQADMQVLISATAVLKWRAQHGAGFPDRLEEAMSPVPVDPFDGQPLRYRREGNGFVVYSVGKDGKFDGGAPDTAPSLQESCFRFPKPAWVKSGYPKFPPPRMGPGAPGGFGGGN